MCTRVNKTIPLSLSQSKSIFSSENLRQNSTLVFELINTAIFNQYRRRKFYYLPITIISLLSTNEIFYSYRTKLRYWLKIDIGPFEYNYPRIVIYAEISFFLSFFLRGSRLGGQAGTANTLLGILH